MNVGPVLKRPVHSGDQANLVLEPFKRLYRGSELVERFDAELRVLLAQRFHHPTQVPLWNDVVGLARKEATSDNAYRHVKVSHPPGHTSFGSRSGHALEAWKSQSGAAKSVKECPS